LLDERSYLSTKEEVRVDEPGTKLRLINIALSYCNLLLVNNLRGVSPVPKYSTISGKKEDHCGGKRMTA
jgi:hypothetical protein